MGPYYVHHPSYFRRPQGPQGENYLEGLIRWLTQVQEGNYLPVLMELQAILGEATLPLTKIVPQGPVTPPPAFLHQNYPTCRDWMIQCSLQWLKPEPFPELVAKRALLARLIDPAVQTHGAPPALLERLDKTDTLYPSIPRSARRPHSSSPEERHIRPHHEAPKYPEEELRPYEEEDRFPVELSPFVYLNSQERLEDELMDRYGSGVAEWHYEEPCLVLIFIDKDRARRALESQCQASRSYPSEPSARALPYSEGRFQSWDTYIRARYTEDIDGRHIARTQKYPAPGLVKVRGSFMCPPETIFKSTSLESLFFPKGPPKGPNPAQTLMSRYLILPAMLTGLLEQRRDQLLGMSASLAVQLCGATGELLAVLTNHLSYEEPLQFNIPIPLHGFHRDALTWAAREIPEIDPTSIGAQGTYSSEQFRWNRLYERYEVILDDLNLDDIGVLDYKS
ncbi:hypothetical protein BS47DRAFT_1359580 [Hydnum rufescens UP504]|uniref:Uncharacterized protein n=1 Tax=Hydnum rufescens UP504 TaxID=1448309 RepID=A0A9P6B4S6_9AGAM|nr:hypothetical protein BS47DRAFT_1359580 [Hydnum rufescens UP504]